MTELPYPDWDDALCVGQSERDRLKLFLNPYPFHDAPGAEGIQVTERKRRSAVLLLHGGNTSRDTFLYPNGGLARFLKTKGHDVWLLDWRGSPKVVDALIDDPAGRHLGRDLAEERSLFTLDEAAQTDLPAAIRKVREMCPKEDYDLSLVGHCLGGGTIAMATARGLLEEKEFEVKNIVLSTMGLFYEVPWSGWIKAEDFLIERVLHEAPGFRGVSPKQKWPKLLEDAYEHWPSAWLPECGSSADDMLRRLAFMFGQPFSMSRFHPTLRNGILLGFFGYLHMGLYLHVGQMVRRGYAAPFDAPDVIDRPRANRDYAKAGVPETSDLVPTYFRNKRVTLIGAAANHLWHRESIDLMYDWLRSSGCAMVTKRVFEGYNIQELMWGERAPGDVYPEIERGVR